MENGRTAYQTAFNTTDKIPCGVLLEPTLAPLVPVSVALDVVVEHLAVRLSLTQVYKHSESTLACTIFSCPIPPGYTVLGFEASGGDGKKSIVGRTQAAHCLTTFRSGALIAKIPFELHLHDKVTVKLTLLTRLYEDPLSNMYFLDIPQTFLPDIPDGDSDWKRRFEVAGRDQSLRSLKVDWRLLAHNRIRDASIPLLQGHSIRSDLLDEHAWITYERRYRDEAEPFLSEDLRLRIATEENKKLLRFEVVQPKDVSQVDPRDRYVFVIAIHPTPATLQSIGMPEAELSKPNTEAIFMLDCSGSMLPYMSQAKRAVLYGLQSLSTHSHFNIVAFGHRDGMKALFDDGCQRFDNAALERGRAFIAGLSAQSGKTDLYTALQHVYTRPVRRGYSRQLYLITNSHESKAHDCIQASRDSSSTRIFTFGLLPLVDEGLVKGLAEHSGGQCTLLSDADELTQALLRTLETSLVPCLANVEITYSVENDGPGTDECIDGIRNCFVSIPLVFLNGRQLMYAISGDKLLPSTAVTLTGLIGEREVRVTDHLQEVGVDSKRFRTVEGTASELVLHADAARERIAMLLEPPWEWRRLGEAKYVLFGKTALTSAEEEEVVRLSKTFNIITPLTSMISHVKGSGVRSIGVSSEESVVAHSYEYRVRDDCWQRRLRSQGLPSGPCPATKRGEDGSLQDPDHIPPTNVKSEAPCSTVEYMESVVHDVVHRVVDLPSLDEILGEQRADGSWPPTETTSQMVRMTLRRMKACRPEVAHPDEFVDYDVAWCTALMLALLTLLHSKQEAEYRLMHRRAVAYLAKVNCLPWQASAELEVRSRIGEA